MRTVHAYTPAQQQQDQQQQQQQQQLSSSTNQPNLHQHSSISGYPSVRHSLFRMHSQLRSAPNRRESTQGPIDLSLYRIPRPTPKMTTRSTSTTTSTTLRTIPIITSLVTTPTHTVYSNAVPSSSSSSQTATSTINHEQNTQMRNSISTSVLPKCSSPNSRPIPALSPKLAYSYSNIEENLQCPLCIDRLRDPRALPCQHVFCCTCLKSIPSSNIPYPTIACPLCRRTFPYNGADQFPVSYIHRQLLELVPQNYDINGKCTKCQDKTSLRLCSCCDYLLCQKCFLNDREKILDNIQHIVKTCQYRLKRIHTTRDQIHELNEINRKKIHQIEDIFENFQRKFLEHKQSILNSLNKYNEQINNDFWSKLNLSTRNTTEQYIDVLNQAELVLKKPHTIQFDDILAVFYNLNSINEQLEHANTLIDTYDIQNLLKQNIQINNNGTDDQINVHLNEIDNTEKIFSLIPSTILPRATKRLRKTEPKRHIEQIDEEEEDYDDENLLLKRMKVEYHNDIDFDDISSPTNSIFCLNSSNNEQQQNDNDNDIIYIETIPPENHYFEELFQIIGTNE